MPVIEREVVLSKPWSYHQWQKAHVICYLTDCDLATRYGVGYLCQHCFGLWLVASTLPDHYGDVIMGTIASQITRLTIVYWTVYSDANERKHQSSAPLAFGRGIQRGPVNSLHKWPVTRKMFPFDDVIMHMPEWMLTCQLHFREQNSVTLRQFTMVFIYEMELGNNDSRISQLCSCVHVLINLIRIGSMTSHTSTNRVMHVFLIINHWASIHYWVAFNQTLLNATSSYNLSKVPCFHSRKYSCHNVPAVIMASQLRRYFKPSVTRT